jgi:hypothetical protein
MNVFFFPRASNGTIDPAFLKLIQDRVSWGIDLQQIEEVLLVVEEMDSSVTQKDHSILRKLIIKGRFP